ncbi:MAG: chorismate mutase [Erysipelotrichaceae bacterium]|nr:chorismate mutase [Erysipelotrichaceae bacterium]MDY5251908.1 chorismate mutase [Erysipelotrichaceae bacterium]
MDELSQARLLINEVDEQMASLFVKRMQAAEKVVAYKMEHGLAIFDPQREKDVIAQNVTKVPKTYRRYYEEYLQMMMDISKKYQQAIMEETENG